MLREPNAAAAPGFSGTGQTIHVIAGGAVSAGAYAVLEIRLPAAAAPPARRHDHEDQALLLLEGDATVLLDGQPLPLLPGRWAHLPRGIPHRTCAGPAGARLLCVCTPAGYEELAGALQDPAITPDDLAALQAAAGVHAVATRW
jgi:quercetin dioxygenase-like cupin family protein